MLPAPLNRLGVQITLATTVLIVAVGALVVWQVDGIIRSNERDRESQRLLLARQQATQQLAIFRDLSVTGAAVLATQPEMQAAIATRNLGAALNVATVFFSQTAAPLPGAPGLQIYDTQGNLLIRAHAPLNGRQETVPPEVLTVLEHRAALGAIRNDELLGVSIAGITPVLDASGAVVGVIETLTGLDRRFVADQARLLGVDVAILLPDGTSIASNPNSTLDPGSITYDVREASEGGMVLTVDGGTQQYLTAVLPLADVDGERLADFYLGINADVVSSAAATVRFHALRATIVGAALAVILITVLSTLIIRPLRSLLDSAIAIQSNDLNTPVPQTGPQEVRDLAEAMDDMRLAIRQSREVMLSVNRDLSTRFDASFASLSEVTQELTVIHRVLAALTGETPGGLPGVADELTQLDWVDTAIIGLASAEGRLTLGAVAGITPTNAEQLLITIEGGVRGQRLEDGLTVSNTAATPETHLLPGYEVGGFAAQAIMQPDGVLGVIVLATRGTFDLTRPRAELMRTVAREIAVMLERGELADEVEENRRIAESVLREMSDGVLVFDRAARCRVCNPAAARLLNRSRAEIIGHDAEEYLPLTRESIETLRRRANSPNSGPVTPLLAEVAGRQLAISAGPFVDPDPERSGMMVLIRDLSAEAEAERVKQDFVSMVGHELRTLLTLIRTTIDLLHEGDAGALNDTQQRIIEVLVGNTDRLMSLITDILDMSAIDSGRMQIAPETTDLGETVRDAVEEAMPAARAKQHTLFTEAPLGLTVWADRKRIDQVLANLISNAIKYTPPGGRIEVGIRADNGVARVWVRDNGIGIPPEEQTHLFEKFYRTTSGHRTTGGTGLGLAIARSLVEMHEGRIWCESDGETGTAFIFTLPRRRI